MYSNTQETGVQTKLVELITREMALSSPLQLHVLRSLISSLQFKCGIATLIGECHVPPEPAAAPTAPPLQRILNWLLGAPPSGSGFSAAFFGAHWDVRSAPSQRLRPLLRTIIARLNFFQLCSGFSRIVSTYELFATVST